MTKEQVNDWLNRYIEAWKSYDPDEISALFTEDATYSYGPWSKPVQGREAILKSWLTNRDAPGSWSAEYEAYAVDGDRAVAEGISRYFGADGKTVDREYWNLWKLEFDEEGRCRMFSEYYMQTPKKKEA